MKKYFYLISAVFALASCSEKIEQPETELVSSKKIYSVTVNAGKAATKALADAGTSLTATWTAGDAVDVQYGGSSVGTLTAASDGPSTKLTGTITGSFSGGETLELRYRSNAYTAQGGTLDYIASNCDYSTATVTITAVSGDNLTISDAAFTSQQAITKFTLLKPDGTSPLSAGSIIITAAGLEGNKITVTAVDPLDEVYIAMANSSGEKKEYLFIITEAGTGTMYFATKKANLVNEKYYATSLTAKGTVASAYDLSESYVSTYPIPNNSLLYQSDPATDKNIPLTVGSGYRVNLFNVHVSVPAGKKSNSAMTCNGSAIITLYGDNRLAGYTGYSTSDLGTAGIDAPSDPSSSTVTISGPGNLEAVGGWGAAGIGASAICGLSGHVHANLLFNGTGTITASSKRYGAGIGSALMYNSGQEATLVNSIGDITIDSGTIIATSSAGIEFNNASGAGIGSGAGYGSGSSYKAKSSCGIITINGGNVTATGGKEGAGIGTGACAANYSYSQCGDIEINGGTVIATGTSEAPGIGASRGQTATYNCTCGNITIGSGVTSVTATRGKAVASVECIGRGINTSLSVCGTVTVSAGLTDSGEPSGSGLIRTITQ